MTLCGNTLYGTTAWGGNLSLNNGSGYGTVFSLPVSGGTPTTLSAFNGTNGEGPYGGLTLSGDTLYGTTEYGGAYGDGTVYSIPLGGGTPTVLASFDGSNGSGPSGNLTLIGNTLYGTTYGGGANNDGTVFAVNIVPEPSTLSLLVAGSLLLAGYASRTRRQAGACSAVTTSS